MRKCVSFVLIGMVLAGCRSTKEVTSDGPESMPLRPSFDQCIRRAEAITPKMQDCIEAEYVFQHARMEAALSKQQPDIAGEQAAWLHREESECPWDSQNGGQAQRLDANLCSLQRIARRADELEARLVR